MRFLICFSLNRSIGSVLILWAGGLLVPPILHTTERALYGLIGIGAIHSTLVIVMPFIVYAILVYAASAYYFRNDRGGAFEGAMLGFIAGLGWYVMTVLENFVLYELDFGTTVQHYDPLGWTLLICAFAVFGAINVAEFSKT